MLFIIWGVILYCYYWHLYCYYWHLYCYYWHLYCYYWHFKVLVTKQLLCLAISSAVPHSAISAN